MAVGLVVVLPSTAHAADGSITITDISPSDPEITFAGGTFYTTADGDYNLYVGDLTDELANDVVEVETTAGDIVVNTAIEWSAPNDLILHSGNNVAVNANVTNPVAQLNIYAPGNITVDSGATITTTNLLMQLAASATVDGVVAGSGDLGIEIPGTVTLSGTNTFFGNTTVWDGTLALVGTGSIANSFVVKIEGVTATFDISDLTTGGTSIQDLLTVAGSTVNLGSNSLTFGADFASTIAGTVVGSGSLIKTGMDSASLFGVNTYTGATVVNEGGINLLDSGSIASSSGVELNASGAYLDIQGVTANTATIQDLWGASGSLVVLGSKTLNVGSANSTSFGGSFTGDGSVIKQGVGTLSLSGYNAYGGDTIVAAGELKVNGTLVVAIGSTATVAAGATLSNNSPTTLINNWLVVVEGTGTLTNNAFVNNTAGLIIVEPGATLDGGAALNKLTFDANGGTGTFSAAEPGTDFDLTKLNTFSMNPTWAGHTLQGWSTSSTSRSLVTSPHTFANDDTLFAVWETTSTPTYQVTLVQPPGGRDTASPTTATAGTTIRLSAAPVPGSSFVRWDVKPAVIWTSGSATSEQAAFTMPASNVTVTPVRQPLYAPVNAAINPTAASFNLNRASTGHSDIMVTLSPGSYTLTALRCGGYDLQLGKDYTVSPYTTATSWDAQAVGASVYTFLKEFLATLTVGTHTIEFVMSGGTNPILTVTVTDSRPITPPLTGDANNQSGWSTTLLAALLGLGFMAVWARRLRRDGTW